MSDSLTKEDFGARKVKVSYYGRIGVGDRANLRNYGFEVTARGQAEPPFKKGQLFTYEGDKLRVTTVDGKNFEAEAKVGLRGQSEPATAD